MGKDTDKEERHEDSQPSGSNMRTTTTTTTLGCDNDALDKCLKDISASSLGTDCKGTLSKCIDDAGCCDADVEGKDYKGKRHVDEFCKSLRFETGENKC